MVVLGLLLLAAAVVAVIAAVTSNSGSVDIHLWGLSVSHLSVGVVFVIGMVTTVVAVVGLMLFAGGMRRGRRLRKEKNRLAHENRQLAAQAEAGPALNGTWSGDTTGIGTTSGRPAQASQAQASPAQASQAQASQAQASQARTDLPRSERVDPA